MNPVYNPLLWTALIAALIGLGKCISDLLPGTTDYDYPEYRDEDED